MERFLWSSIPRGWLPSLLSEDFLQYLDKVLSRGGMLLNTSHISLDAAGLVALADLTPIAKRTAITGTASYLDVFLLAPGIHTQQAATELNKGEYPAVGALHSGYVFRVENPATVRYLQTVGKTGHLTTVRVKKLEQSHCWKSIAVFFCGTGHASSAVYLSGVLLTFVAIFILVLVRDWWSVGILFMLMFARLCNVIVVRRRCQRTIEGGWKGASEPDKKYGDLLVLLSQDRWVRMLGTVDELKRVTAGGWLDDETALEDGINSLQASVVYLAAALAQNETSLGKVILLGLLLLSAGVLGLSNTLARDVTVFDCILTQEGAPKPYKRRRDLADDLIRESGREDWALGLGMIPLPSGKLSPPVIM